MNELAQYLPKKAYRCLQANVGAFLFDVRTEAENKFVGRPLNSMLVPWVDEPDWQPHPQNFIAAIKCSTLKLSLFFAAVIVLMMLILLAVLQVIWMKIINAASSMAGYCGSNVKCTNY